jgi:chromosome segregation ATPase
MIKKLLFWSALAVGGLVLVNTVKPGAVTTWGKRLHAKIEKKLSPEFELARIKDQIRELTPDMYKNITKIAEEMVAVEAQRNKVADMDGRLAKQKGEIQALTAAMERGDKTFVFAGTNLTPTKVRSMLKSYTEGEKALETAKKTLAAREQKLESARQQLVEIKKQKEALEQYVVQFEAEIEALKLEQTRGKFAVDDTRLSEIKDSLEKLRQRVEAKRKEVELTGEFFGNAPKATEKTDVTAEDVIAEVKEKFGEKTDK